MKKNKYLKSNIKNKVVKIDENLETTDNIVCTVRDAKTGEIKRKTVYHNIVVTVWKNALANRQAGGTNTAFITLGAVGTNGAAVGAGDTTLGTELARKALALVTPSGNQVLTTTFFGAPEAVGAIAEFALFGELATVAADSGTMVNHALISELKTNAETLTIQCTITNT